MELLLRGNLLRLRSSKPSRLPTLVSFSPFSTYAPKQTLTLKPFLSSPKNQIFHPLTITQRGFADEKPKKDDKKKGGKKKVRVRKIRKPINPAKISPLIEKEMQAEIDRLKAGGKLPEWFFRFMGESRLPNFQDLHPVKDQKRFFKLVRRIGIKTMNKLRSKDPHDWALLKTKRVVAVIKPKPKQESEEEGEEDDFEAEAKDAKGAEKKK
eukprot:TRINITY_DN1714_c0_g1_i1.p1 TRINITY_DN1714_c0_g1~~TRINITY_DN1714_c0_g1_i1.p1  ORF type:complete len:210 (-),score=51.69 TRINITY_DN1714_c0_g1_i1:175-804(-)